MSMERGELDKFELPPPQRAVVLMPVASTNAAISKSRSEKKKKKDETLSFPAVHTAPFLKAFWYCVQRAESYVCSTRACTDESHLSRRPRGYFPPAAPALGNKDKYTQEKSNKLPLR